MLSVDTNERGELFPFQVRTRGSISQDDDALGRRGDCLLETKKTTSGTGCSHLDMRERGLYAAAGSVPFGRIQDDDVYVGEERDRIGNWKRPGDLHTPSHLDMRGRETLSLCVAAVVEGKQKGASQGTSEHHLTQKKIQPRKRSKFLWRRGGDSLSLLHWAFYRVKNRLRMEEMGLGNVFYG
mmetsp:Transcript_28195/g.65257  ORF Transcript_28195/g.65257 Transcript_28195/m.65257 type:complete len:182 (+) Transcript_28195:849-1394(+)